MKNVLLILLAALCLYLFIDAKLKESRLSALAAQNEKLEEGLQRQIILQGRQIIYKQKESPAQKHYLPPEGTFDIRQYEDGNFKLTVKNKGITLRPFAAVFAAQNSRFEAAIGARLLYWNRWGAGMAWAPQSGPLAVIDRRLDDIVPLTQNTSIMLFGGKQILGIGLAVYL